MEVQLQAYLVLVIGEAQRLDSLSGHFRSAVNTPVPTE